MSAPCSANVIICSEVLVESKTDLLSAIRMMSAITIPPAQTHIHFWSMVLLSSQPGDHDQHRVWVKMIGPDDAVISSAEEYSFQYGYKVLASGNGGFSLRTEFTVGVAQLQSSGTYWIKAYVDGNLAALAPITLRR